MPHRGTLRWAEQFSELIPSVLARYLSEPNTLVHGDFRLDNMFFDAHGDAAGPFVLVDWQMAMRSPGRLGSRLLHRLEPHDLRRAWGDGAGARRALSSRPRRRRCAGEYATVERLWHGYLEGVLFYTVTFGVRLFGIDPANERGVMLSTSS